MTSVLTDAKVQAVATSLSAQSASQDQGIGAYFSRRAAAGELSWDGFDAESHHFMADKLVALEPAKAEFCHLLCRATGARRIVEVGTSHGLSTLYLATAVRANGGGVVIGTEHEPAKAQAARANFAAADLADLIDLREGDLRQTLEVLEGPIDFVLIDIWVEMARPAIELIAPHLRTGAIVCADNTIAVAPAYGAYFEYIKDPDNGFVTQTLPFDGGFEMSVKTR